MSVSIILTKWSVFPGQEELGSFETDNSEKVLGHVLDVLSKNYRPDEAFVQSHTKYRLNGIGSSSEGDGVPKPAGTYIEICFGREHDRNTLITKINELFEGCDKYKPVC